MKDRASMDRRAVLEIRRVYLVKGAIALARTLSETFFQLQNSPKEPLERDYRLFSRDRGPKSSRPLQTGTGKTFTISAFCITFDSTFDVAEVMSHFVAL